MSASLLNVILSEPEPWTKFTPDALDVAISYNGLVTKHPAWIAALIALIMLVLSASCAKRSQEHTWSELNLALELETRLREVDFSLVESDMGAVERSRGSLERSGMIPNPWPIRFAGEELPVSLVDALEATGITHENGRLTVIYPMPEPRVPGYGELVPIAIAHYFVPSPRLDIVLLLVCFQADPDGSLAGIGVRSVGTDGVEISAPFALALAPGELPEGFFYGEFMGSGKDQMVAARGTWDRGFLLISRLSEDAILSTYLPWY